MDSEGPDQTAQMRRMPDVGLGCPHMPEGTFCIAQPIYNFIWIIHGCLANTIFALDPSISCDVIYWHFVG